MPATPHVAILGAGPIGLDAALACLDAGWPFTLYETGHTPAAHVRAWGTSRCSPHGTSTSPAG
jgi:NADPH-dependent 2,4-dienoyl-CoA reductase/sulfur reductase-like enzyme